MSGTAIVNDQLFDGGPLLRWERSLGLVKPGRRRAARRTLIAVLICWLPLAVLTTAQFLISADQSAKAFFADIAVHARFLVAVPALIFAGVECIPRLGRIVNHFTEAGLITGPDRVRFQAAVSSTRRLLDSTIADVVIVVLVYFVVAGMALYFSTDSVLVWQRRGPAGSLQFSPAGWWHALVSLPLLLIIFFAWLWRLVLWSRFIFLMSRLDLQLIPGHPDRAGGLRFVSTSFRGFRLISFACGAIVAGAIANRQVHLGTQPLEFKSLVIGMMVFLLVLFAGPLTIFLGKLREAKTRGMFEYGALARTLGTQFEEKWLRQKRAVEQASLEVQDFSATTDLFAVVDNVYAMREVPFTLKDLILPIGVSAMIPFIPLVLLAMPMEVILRGLVKLLF